MPAPDARPHHRRSRDASDHLFRRPEVVSVLSSSSRFRYSATTSRPWAVSAQMIATSTAMIAIDQIG